jgi:hypothetical protein
MKFARARGHYSQEEEEEEEEEGNGSSALLPPCGFDKYCDYCIRKVIRPRLKSTSAETKMRKDLSIQ